MKVARIHQTGGPEQIRLDELATPEPKPGQVRVRVQAAGVNFIDIYHRSGQYQVPLPFALGQEGAGTVKDEVIVYTEKDFVTEVKALTQGQLAHVVYDGVGKDVFDQNLLCLRRRGYEVLFGQSSGAVAPVDPQVLSHDRDELSWRSGDLFQWIREGKLSVRIDRTFPLEEAAEAHRALASRQTSGKLLLIP